MGTRHSKASDKTSADQAADVLHAPSLEALKLARQNPVSNLSFEKLLLNFPLLENGFSKLEEVFNEASGNATDSTAGKTVNVQGMRQARQKLGFQIDESSLNHLFPRREDASLKLTFNDMVVVLAILAVHLGPEKAVEQGADQEVVRSLMLAVNSFNHFDKNGDGTLVQEDVTGVLEEVDKPAHAKRIEEPGAGGGDIQRRWQFMDVDKDGRANFQDYLNSLHNWVMN